jgi:hypothetical protein
MENCLVGLFRMPGLTFKKNTLSTELIDEMDQWSKDNHCGMKMTDTLWSFKNEKHRDWFVLRWSDQIPLELCEGL